MILITILNIAVHDDDITCLSTIFCKSSSVKVVRKIWRDSGHKLCLNRLLTETMTFAEL